MEVKDGQVIDLLFEIKGIVAETKADVSTMKGQIKQNCEDIETLKGRPARRWESVVGAVVATTVATIAAIFTKKI